jgi:hypothetical protein
VASKRSDLPDKTKSSSVRQARLLIEALRRATNDAESVIIGIGGLNNFEFYG